MVSTMEDTLVLHGRTLGFLGSWSDLLRGRASTSPCESAPFHESPCSSGFRCWISMERSVLVAQSRPTLCDPARLLCLWDSPGKNAGVGCLSLLQGIFPTQGSNPGLLHCRQTCSLSEPPGKPLRVNAKMTQYYHGVCICNEQIHLLNAMTVLGYTC